MTRRATGEGSVYETKQGRWVGATYADTNTGGRKRVVVYGRTRAVARKKLCDLQKELDAGVRVSVENWTVQATSSTGSKRWSNRTEPPRPTRATSSSCGCTWARSSVTRSSAL